MRIWPSVSCAVVVLSVVAVPRPVFGQNPPVGKIRTGEQARVIVGFEQAGASSADSDQKFFFDFYISRPVPFGWMKAGDPFGERLRWWGNLRVGSYPQQISTPVGEFVGRFADEVRKLPVNRLVQSAEFLGGIDVRFLQSRQAEAGQSEDSDQRFAMSFFAAFGAVGPLKPQDTLKVFKVPPAGAAQRARFDAAFPQAAGRDYIGFVSPDRNRFYRQWTAGLRLTTFYGDDKGSYNAAPAIVSVGLGQNEIVTGGRLSGWVMRFEAFYPLPLKERWSRLSSVYLFGSAQMALQKAMAADPFILEPATARDASGADVQVPGFHPQVALVSTASNRDLYKIGVGIDVVKLFNKE